MVPVQLFKNVPKAINIWIVIFGTLVDDEFSLDLDTLSLLIESMKPINCNCATTSANNLKIFKETLLSLYMSFILASFI